MEKSKILSKLNIDIKDYNNELEKILENKLFSYDVKNLLLSMLYKIENAYKDYETVKVEALSKKEYIENLLRIIREKAIKILLVKSETPEAEELEKNNVTYKIDKENGEIVCFQNELVILTALLKLDETNVNIEVPYDYLEKPLNEMLKQGKIDSMVEVIRDFNGWSWDIVTKDIGDIEDNLLYQIIILLHGKKKIGIKNLGEIEKNITKLAIQKYISNSEDKEYVEKFEKIKKTKQERLELFKNKKEFLNQITEDKKIYTKQIEKIDRILNNNELLKKEYYERNEKLPNKEKIFSISYLVGILDKERVELLEKIDECNKVILPKEFVEQKTKLEGETSFLNSVKDCVSRDDIIEICKNFITDVEKKIHSITEETKDELVSWIYKIRYFRYIPVNETEKVRDVTEFKKAFELLIKLIIKKAQKLKVWDVFSEDAELTYRILKEVFDSKIIYLQNINIQCRYEDKVLDIEYYDDTVMDSSLKVNIDSVKIKKKFKLFI